MFLRPRSWLPQPFIDLFDASRYDLATAWGRLWQRPYRSESPEYVQVGSGDNLIPSFLNTDHFINKDADFPVDIRYPLPFASNRWKGIYAHHIVEHVWFDQAQRFFREAHRILRTGGIIRIVVPDAEKFIRIYAGPQSDRMAHFERLLPNGSADIVKPNTAMGFVGYAFHCNPFNVHRSAWDYETLSLALSNAGFSRVTRSECGQSHDPHMERIDKSHWAEHSLYVEAVK